VDLKTRTLSQEDLASPVPLLRDAAGGYSDLSDGVEQFNQLLATFAGAPIAYDEPAPLGAPIEGMAPAPGAQLSLVNQKLGMVELVASVAVANGLELTFRAKACEEVSFDVVYFDEDLGIEQAVPVTADVGCRCDATTCPNGCCDVSGACRLGTEKDACGTGGAECTACAIGCTAARTCCQDGCGACGVVCGARQCCASTRDSFGQAIQQTTCCDLKAPQYTGCIDPGLICP
jgi:hypothetical protein